MSPLKSIIVFLLAGVSRMPGESRTETLLTIFAGVLPDMTLEEVAAAREQVIAQFWTTPAPRACEQSTQGDQVEGCRRSQLTV